MVYSIYGTVVVYVLIIALFLAAHHMFQKYSNAEHRHYVFCLWKVKILKLTRGERFKDARTEYNQHGRQTMDEVFSATGISKSLIQALEDDESTRSVGYDKISTLAAHYGVSSDFLLSLTDDPYPKRTAVDDLGLSAKAVKQLRELKKQPDTEALLVGLNMLIESHYFRGFLQSISQYLSVYEVEMDYLRSLGTNNNVPNWFTEDKLAEELTAELRKTHPQLPPVFTVMGGYEMAHHKLDAIKDNVGLIFRDVAKILELDKLYR